MIWITLGVIAIGCWFVWALVYVGTGGKAENDLRKYEQRRNDKTSRAKK